MLVKVRDLSPKKNTEQNLWRWNGSKGTGGKQRWVPLFPFHLHGGGENMAHGMFKMRCKFKFETHFLCMDSLKSVARGKRGTHDNLQAQWPGNEVAKAHCQLWSLKIWIDKLFPNRSCKISLCVCLETMEIQLEQSLLFESDEILFLSVKSKGDICISKECEVFIGKLIPTMQSQAILLFCFHGKIDGQPC